MDLQENIYRIQSMMGVITEDKRNTILSMIDKIGLHDTIKMVGGYPKLKKILGNYEFSKEDKINFIKSRVRALSDEFGNHDGVLLEDIDVNDIIIKDDGDELEKIEYLGVDYVLVDVFKEIDGDWEHQGDWSCGYDELPNELFDGIFNLMTRV